MHVAFLHSALNFSGTTERLLAAARASADHGARVSVLSPGGSRAAAFGCDGIETVPAEVHASSVRAPFQFWRTRRLLRGLAPDLLHVTDQRLAPFAAELSRALHLPWMLELNRPAQRALVDPSALLRAVVVPCETSIESAVNRGRVPRALLYVLRHGPALELDRASRTFDEIERPCVGCVGLLDEDHGTEVFLEAARRLTRSGRTLRFLVLGEGPREDHLRRRVRQLELTEQVTIAAPALDDARNALREFDIHVSCTLEGGPGWLACQALGMGIPSIFSSVHASYQLIEDKRTGLIVERADPAKLAGQIDVLLENPRAACQLGSRARARLLEADDAVRFSEGIARLHERALASAATSPA
ncbi:MAG: glycosyltransferase family 4 protein [Planctomycetes bacterium]|nr:glycosyltransferase family 4 protein [Planctomycetota bacterium]MCB9903408.1 glycosyltransferase family 4 protein [Planctomycetota bacterium]